LCKFSDLGNTFEVPQILNSFLEDDNYTIHMPFYQCPTFVDFANVNKMGNIIDKIDQLFNFIESNLSRSSSLPVDRVEWNKKITSVINTVQKKHDGYLPEALDLLDVDISVPVGLCHGDLTFSNILIDKKIILLDFLDNVIETPLFDLCKLHQEVDLLWTITYTDSDNVDYPRLRIIYSAVSDHIKTRTKEVLSNNDISADTFILFYKLTLLRLMPYVDKSMLHKIKHILQSIKA
jgi:thiamine kinase-like enzyme